MGGYFFPATTGEAGLPVLALEQARNATSAGTIGPWCVTLPTMASWFRLMKQERQAKTREPFTFAERLVRLPYAWVMALGLSCRATANGFWPWSRPETESATWSNSQPGQATCVPFQQATCRCKVPIFSPTEKEFWSLVTRQQPTGNVFGYRTQ